MSPGRTTPALSVRFWGVRGSLPAPGSSTCQVGGNTSCVEVRAGDRLLILDMGTGLRPLGDHLLAAGGPVRATLLLSHYHWDHIQGLPFFAPAFVPGSELHIHGPRRGGREVREILGGQMTSPYFPVGLDAMVASLTWSTLQDGTSLTLGDTIVHTRELHHPGGVLSFRIERGGKSVVYATDFEHGTSADEVLVEHARGADCLIFDAMYTPAEYHGDGAASRVGWGHSTWTEAARIATAAGVKRLVLFHHDPRRDDAGVAALVDLTRAAFRAGETRAAVEGETLEL